MKDPVDYRVNRTRHIPLKEADENKSAKRMDKGAMVAADVYDLFANEKYMSRLCQ